MYLFNQLLASPEIMTGTAADYFPIILQIIFAAIFVGVMIAVSAKVGPKRKTSDKLVSFTSGIAARGAARQPMAIKYFLVAILFVLFDVEVVFFYPYAVNLKSLGRSGFEEVLVFVVFFLIGYFYIIKKGALKWED